MTPYLPVNYEKLLRDRPFVWIEEKAKELRNTGMEGLQAIREAQRIYNDIIGKMSEKSPTHA
jgi:hypothetical protein